jgi:hypothetical protein
MAPQQLIEETTKELLTEIGYQVSFGEDSVETWVYLPLNVTPDTIPELSSGDIDAYQDRLWMWCEGTYKLVVFYRDEDQDTDDETHCYRVMYSFNTSAAVGRC